MTRRLKIAVLMLSVLAFFCAIPPVSGSSGDLKALIVTGQSNPYHDWQISSRILKQLLEETGLFKVDIAVNEAGENGGDFSPKFSEYDVVVLNYEGRDWPAQTKEAFVKYVESGGGVVVYHSADNAFPGWKEFNQIIGLGGWGGRDERWGPMVLYRDGKVVFDNTPGPAGTHPPGHDFQVINRDREHPVTKGLPEKWMHGADDLYSKLRGPAENLTVLATAYADPAVKNKWGQGTGEHEPVLFAIKYGKGRVFHTALGHINKFPMPSVRCVGFIVTFQRGAEWTARGKVTQKVPVDFPTASKVSLRKGYAKKLLDDLLAEIASYQYGQSREPLSDLDNLIGKANPSEEVTRQIETGLAEFLQSNASLAGKQFVCEKLSVLGTDASVAVLTKMLVKADTSDMARYALERIPGSAVDDALRDTLSKTSGKIKAGIINTIGQRRDSKSLEVLGGLVYDSRPEIAAASVSALGKIGGLEATSMLSKARKKTSGRLQEQAVHAYLECANQFAAQGYRNQSLGVYLQLYKGNQPVPVRVAALRGIVGTTGGRAAGIITEALRSNEPQMRAAAIVLVREVPAEKIIDAAIRELLNLDTDAQVQLLGALAGAKSRSVLPVITKAVKSDEVSIRVAALKALGKSGDASSVELLAETAAKAGGDEQDAARESLYRLRGVEADEKIIALIKKAEPEVKVELIKSTGLRNMRGATEVLLQTAQDADRRVRIESVKALKVVADEKYLPVLIELLTKAKKGTQHKELEKTVAAVANKIEDENKRTGPILEAVKAVKDVETKCSLLSVLAKIGDKSALKAVRGALEDGDPRVRDAAVRVLSEWPRAEGMDGLLRIAQSSDNNIHQVLALRGYIRLIGVAGDITADEKVGLYVKAMGLAEHASEKRMVLSGLGGVESFEALKAAAEYLDDKALQQEAAVAVVKIAKETGGKDNPKESRRAIRKVLKIAKSEQMREQAADLLNKIK